MNELQHVNSVMSLGIVAENAALDLAKLSYCLYEQIEHAHIQFNSEGHSSDLK